MDVGAAIHVLYRRNRTNDKGTVDLSGADFRRFVFPVPAQLAGTNFAGARMAFCRLRYSDLSNCFFLTTDLRGASLVNSDLSKASLYRAKLENADFEEVRLEGTLIENVDLTHVRNLTLDQLRAAVIDEETILPPGIDREALAAATDPETARAQS